jgi:hypothetical protein
MESKLKKGRFTTINIDSNAKSILEKVKEDLRQKGIYASYSDVIRYLAQKAGLEVEY